MQLHSRITGLLLLALTVAACTGTQVRETLREAVPGVITGTLQGLNDPATQRLTVQLLESPEMRRAARELMSGVLDDTLATLSQPERQARIDAVTRHYLQTVTRSLITGLAQGVRNDLSPALSQMLHDTITRTVHEALGANAQRDIERLAAGLTKSTMEAASRGMAQGIQRDLVPAVRNALAEPQTSRALGSATRDLVREAMLGGNDALVQIEREQNAGQRASLIGRISALTNRGLQVTQWVAAAAVALSVLLALWIVRLIFRARRAQADSENSAADALMLAEAIRATEGQPWSKEFTSLVGEHLKRSNGKDPLQAILARRSVVTAPPKGRRRLLRS